MAASINEFLNVSIITPQSVLFEGKARSVILPGERGFFEILANHKPLLSRMIAGALTIDGRAFSIRRGIIKIALNNVNAIVETGS